MKYEEAVAVLAGTGRPGALARVNEEVEALRVRAEAAEAKVLELLDNSGSKTEVPVEQDPLPAAPEAPTTRRGKHG